MSVDRFHGRTLLALLLAAIVAVVVGFPATFVLLGIARGLLHPAPQPIPISYHLLWPTLAVCGSVVLLAVALALPAAWAARRWPRILPMLLVPLLLPSYLAYTGWGMLRAPGTWLGDWLLRGPAGVGASGNWWPVAAGRVQAVMGLVLWAWPIAAFIMAAAFSRIDEGVLDELRVDGAPWWRRATVVLSMARGGIAAGAVAVFLIVVGSAVPLNVALMDTYANTIWRLLDELPWDQRWRVWIAAWPLVFVAVAAGVFVTRRLVAGDWDEFLSARAGRSGGVGTRAAAAGTALVWSLAVLAPLGITLSNLHGLRPLVTFWRLSGSAVVSSGAIAGAVAAISIVILVAVWLGAESRGWARTVAAACMGVLLASGLTPGVLVGSAIAQAWNHPATDWFADSPAVVVAGHIARFGFVPAIAGWFFAASEARSLRELRRIDAGSGVRGWATGALLPRIGMAAAVSVACGILSFHEIESAVMLQPPTSVGGGFAWRMLQALHFNREEDLVPAMVTVLEIGIAAAGMVVALQSLGRSVSAVSQTPQAGPTLPLRN